MAQLYKNFKEALLDGDVDLENETIKVQLGSDGQMYVGEMPWHRRILNTMLDMRAKSAHPLFTASHAVIYKDQNLGEPKYFDIETPLYLQDGVWKPSNPLIACIDFENGEKSKVEFV